MYRIIILLTLNLSGTLVLSQNQKFDSIYRITVTEIIYADPQKAFENSDYLFSIASGKANQVKALLLKSEIFRMSGLHKDAIRSILQADSLVTAENYKQKLQIQGLLATNHREIGQLYFARQHLEKSMKILDSIEDPIEKYRLLGSVYQEKAYTDMEGLEYKTAISNVHKSNSYIEKIDPNKRNPAFSFALNHQIIGQNYLKLKEQDSAMFYFKSALEHLDQSDARGSTLRGFILDGMANAAILSGDIENVEAYLDQAMEIARAGNNFNLQKSIYTSKIEFFKDQEEHKKYIDANEESLTLIKDEESRRANARESIYSFLERKQTASIVEQSGIGLPPIFWWTTGFVMSAIGMFLWIKFRRPLPPIQSEEHSGASKEVVSSNVPVKEKPDKDVRDYLNEENMQSILQKLHDFESKQFYLDKKLSLASVAAEVGVNHRYLSHTIKQKYGKDFATYINDLRIAYIIRFLKENPQHLHYKISYLAEKAGFSSHNRFSVIFKKSTGISPSELISGLQEQFENEKRTIANNKNHN